MQKYRVVIINTGAIKGTDLTREQAERLAKQVQIHTGSPVTIEEVK